MVRHDAPTKKNMVIKAQNITKGIHDSLEYKDETMKEQAIEREGMISPNLRMQNDTISNVIWEGKMPPKER